MKKGQTIWAKKLFDDYKDRLTEGRGYTIISSNSDGIIIIDDNGVEIYNGLIWFECFFSITPPHEVVLIAEQPKEEPDQRLFQAALAAMQGMLIREKTPYVERLCNDCWDYAEALINEGKKRGKLD